MPRITNASDARKNCENGFLHLPKLDFHRFSRIFIEVLKIAENLEKQSFTFFAFLPPYIGVSGSLVSRMRKISMRSIDWYQKFLISRLAARYSIVFVVPGRISENHHLKSIKNLRKSTKLYENLRKSMTCVLFTT